MLLPVVAHEYSSGWAAVNTRRGGAYGLAFAQLCVCLAVCAVMCAWHTFRHLHTIRAHAHTHTLSTNEDTSSMDFMRVL